MNVPVEEDFAASSPYRLEKGLEGYAVVDEREGALSYTVRIPHQPKWYGMTTSKGTPMSKVGILQGTYLGIYVSNSCLYWYSNPSQGCKFCTTGLNVGVNEVVDKDLDDVGGNGSRGQARGRRDLRPLQLGLPGGQGPGQRGALRESRQRKESAPSWVSR